MTNFKEILYSEKDCKDIANILNFAGYCLVVDDGYQIADGWVEGVDEGCDDSFHLSEPGIFIVVSEVRFLSRYVDEEQHIEAFDADTVKCLLDGANWWCDYGVK